MVPPRGMLPLTAYAALSGKVQKKQSLGAPAIKQVYMSNNEPPKVIKDYFRRFCYFL